MKVMEVLMKVLYSKSNIRGNGLEKRELLIDKFPVVYRILLIQYSDILIWVKQMILIVNK